MKRLILDIETAPNTVYTWGLWNQNVGLNQIIEPGYVLCVGAKWYQHDDEYYFASLHEDGAESMLQMTHELMEQAEAIIHYNGTYFDIPTLNREFVLHGFPPPAKACQIDLLTTVRKQFKFPSNKLAYVANALGVGYKAQQFDMELWKQCMAGDAAAWAEMQEYNLNDLDLTEAVYDRLLPWIKGHPNMGLFLVHNEPVCPHCGSGDLERRGYVHTKVLTYQRYRCRNCGAWSQDRKRDADAPQNAVKGVA